MGYTVVPRRRANGKVVYRAQIRIRKGGVDHHESATRRKKSDAQQWARKREAEIERDGLPSTATAGAGPTVGALVQRYIDEYEDLTGWERSKGEHLRFLTRQDIAEMPAAAVTSSDLVEHVRRRRLAGTGPATVGNDLTWLSVVFKTAKTAWQSPVDPLVVQEARQACRSLRLVASSGKRDRRPTESELEALEAQLGSRGRANIPMVDIMWFAIHSARRQSEITRLRWDDNDKKNLTGLVRDAKHPRAKKGNHRRFKYTKAAWAIVDRQPRTSEFVFPYNPKSIGAAWQRACRITGVEDLRFHDLRHEATSRLFEAGYDIPEVAQFTLHDSWQELKRYTQLRPELQ